jgi:hypothetical protein
VGNGSGAPGCRRLWRRMRPGAWGRRAGMRILRRPLSFLHHAVASSTSLPPGRTRRPRRRQPDASPCPRLSRASRTRPSPGFFALFSAPPHRRRHKNKGVFWVGIGYGAFLEPSATFFRAGSVVRNVVSRYLRRVSRGGKFRMSSALRAGRRGADGFVASAGGGLPMAALLRDRLAGRSVAQSSPRVRSSFSIGSTGSRFGAGRHPHSQREPVGRCARHGEDRRRGTAAPGSPVGV